MLTKEEVEKVWAETDYYTKLCITNYVFERLKEHMIEGGSYRVLIYDRLGFNTDAYSALFTAFDIHNEVSGMWKDKESENQLCDKCEVDNCDHCPC
jgi:hypothetical protein